MKKLLLTMGLAAITAIGFGQVTFMSFPQSADPLEEFQKGSKNLIVSDNHFLTGFAFSLASVGFYTVANKNSQSYTGYGQDPNDGDSARIMGNLCAATSLGFFLSSYVNKRAGLERIHFTANGIKIDLK
tara:strand:- start:603 stop:989 length:387 start_codon:yes stop_codon:yes gene_type:complete